MTRRHLIVAGAQRSGTTYLSILLEAHPDITMARPSRPEPKVFLADDITKRGYEWYIATYFAHAKTESLLGEKSTSYIEDPLAPMRIAELLGRVDVIFMLRDPIARAISNWRFSSDNGLEQRPLEQALGENLRASCDWDPDATSVSPYAYLERGRYADYLGSWFEAFPNSVHVEFFEEFVGDGAALGRLYSALDVDPWPRPEALSRPVNQSEQAAPALSPLLTEQLRSYFAGADTRLADLLGRKPPWR